MSQIYIPGVGKDDTDVFQPQIWTDKQSSEQLIITGMIDSEMEQSIYVALTIIRSQGYDIPNYLHVHFPNYSYMRCGISASLGIYYSLLHELTHFEANNTYLASGEIDILGNLYDIGNIEEKYNVFRSSQLDYFIVPFITKTNNEILYKDDRVIGIENIRELDLT